MFLKGSKHKKYLIAIVTISLTCLILIWYRTSNPFYAKTLKYKEHKIQYVQYLKGKKKLHEGHYKTNEELFRHANMKLAIELCENYVSGDSSTKSKIESIAQEFCVIKDEYKNIDSLVKHSHTIFDTLIYIF